MAKVLNDIILIITAYREHTVIAAHVITSNEEAVRFLVVKIKTRIVIRPLKSVHLRLRICATVFFEITVATPYTSIVNLTILALSIGGINAPDLLPER
jgi:hypothetical protein